MAYASVIIVQHIPAKAALAIACTLVSGAFGAGVSFQLARDANNLAIAAAVAPVATQADNARQEAFHCEQELRTLRHDLARGIGRALARSPQPQVRDWAGKVAKEFYEREIAQGVPEDVALQHTFESDL
jgi:hypothetical protein